MSPNQARNLKLAAALVLLLGAGVWAFAQFRATQPDATVNNGVNSAMGGPPPEAANAMRKMMDLRRERDDGERFDREAAREAMAEVLTPEEQEAMREGWQRMRERRQQIRTALGPEESRLFGQKIRTRIRQMMARDGFGPPRPRSEGPPDSPNEEAPE